MLQAKRETTRGAVPRNHPGMGSEGKIQAIGTQPSSCDTDRRT